MSEPLITNKQLQTLLDRAEGMSKTHRDTMWEALVFVRGSYERARAGTWQPVAHDDPNNDGPVWVDENGYDEAVGCWLLAAGEKQNSGQQPTASSQQPERSEQP